MNQLKKKRNNLLGGTEHQDNNVIQACTVTELQLENKDGFYTWTPECIDHFSTH